MTVTQPDCIDCKHPSDDHNYSPSGCAGTQCLHAEGGWDDEGAPIGDRCSCTDYNPGDDTP